MSCVEAKDYFDAVTKFIPKGARPLIHLRPGNPDDAQGWWPRVLKTPFQLDEPAMNVYSVVSAFNAGKDGKFARIKDNFACGLLLMIDDIGTGPGAKSPEETINALPPTVLVETSPGNHQALYFFAEPVLDPELFDATIDAFIKQKLLADNGMAGINRYYRPPFGINGKPKYGGWNVRCAGWWPDRRYTLAEIIKTFNLRLKPKVAKAAPRKINATAGQELYDLTVAWLTRNGMARGHRHGSEWLQIKCPWTHEHSDGRDDGAAISPPSESNNFAGGFRCYHGHPEQTARKRAIFTDERKHKLTFDDVTDWIDIDNVDALMSANERACNEI